MGMGNDAVVTRQPRWLFISSALFATAVLAGCSSSSTAGNPTASATSPPSMQGNNGTACVTAALKGACGPYRYPAITASDGANTFVSQNVWNPIPQWSQTLHATSPGSWYVTANMPGGNTAVVSFPDASEEYYYKNTLTGWSAIFSSFAENMNQTSATSAEAAYDIWLNGWRNEVMIQHDIINRGSCSVLAIASFGGSGGVPVQGWNLCTYGSELIWQLRGAPEQAGSVDILAMLTWLERHGYLPQASELVNISYGFEICSTGGRPETFTVSRFSISAPKARR
jgi:hypothetical protein